MPLPVYRLRRWLAAIAALFTLVIAGMYFSARLRQHNVLKEVPGKIAYDVKQTANGFQFSKSEAGRTVFIVRATAVKEFKLNGRTELHQVNITLYGRDASRFDQIYGDDFTYDPSSGDVTAEGEVQIDLQANPEGGTNLDQSMPKALKNPIHLKTRGLVFNKNSGNASTNSRVDFSTPQASGWAVGAEYIGKNNTLTLESQIHIAMAGDSAANLFATHGHISSDPRQIVLDQPRVARAGGTLQADQATFFLTTENNVQRVVVTGNVNATQAAKKEQEGSAMRAHADKAELLLTETHNRFCTAILTGNVEVARSGMQAMQGTAGRVVVDFAGENQVRTVHAVDGARLTQHMATTGSSSNPQDFEITAPMIDFFVPDGRRLERAETSGSPQITITQPQSPGVVAQRAVVTAGKFIAKFATDSNGQNHLASMYGAPDAIIVSSTAGQPDRVSTSQTVDASFLPQGGIDWITQQGNVIYTDYQSPDKRSQAWADHARYTPTDQILVLSGSPRFAQGYTQTTARTIRVNRSTGDAFAEGDVKSTYSELKEQPDGALLASSSPIHVTAESMTAHNSTAIALYKGNARLWQDSNLIEAPSIQFDRDRRFLTAQGTTSHPVSTVLVQSPKAVEGNKQAAKTKKDGAKSAVANAVNITSMLLTYSDAERKAHYEGGVFARSGDFTASSKAADAYLLPRTQTLSNELLSSPGQLEHLVAEGNVSIQQAGRHASGQRLIYTAADEKFILTGGPPSIFDAEQGKITGVSLTFYNRDDRVLVEGEASTPVVTHARMAR
jgi:lipopolysaccharide export system protein LptA